LLKEIACILVKMPYQLCDKTFHLQILKVSVVYMTIWHPSYNSIFCVYILKALFHFVTSEASNW